jgi:ribose/xylose/arabinose/galactoside ABC-type transport system permease subunit
MTAPLSTDAQALDREGTRGLGRLAQVLGQYTIQWLLLIALLIMGIASPNFRSLANLENVLRQASFAGIAAVGMTLLMITGAFDLSVAGMVGLCGVVLAQLLGGLGIAPAILVVLLLGLALGVVNGLVVTKLRIPAFIATLGMMYVYLAAALILTDGQVVPVTDRGFRSLGTGEWLGVPVPFLIMLVVYGAAAIVLRVTKYGRYMRAVGSNETAARTAGLPVDRVRIAAFMAVGLCTALTATLLTGMLSSANAVMSTGFELAVISVVVVGGTSLKGGSGTLLGSFTGALFFAVINNALNMFRVEAYWQYIAVGVILIVALAIDALRRRYMGMDRT